MEPDLDLVKPVSIFNDIGLRRTLVVALLDGRQRQGGCARAGARGRRYEPARRRIETSGGGSGYQARRWSNSNSGADLEQRISGGPRTRAIRGGVVGTPRWIRISRTAGTAVVKAMMMQIAPAEVGHRTRIQPGAANRARMHVVDEWPLDRRRPSAMRKIDALQRVERGPPRTRPSSPPTGDNRQPYENIPKAVTPRRGKQDPGAGVR